MKKRLIKSAGLTVALLLIPFIAMQFTDEVNWTLGDFLMGGILIFGLVTALGFIFQKNRLSGDRLYLSIGIVVIIVLIWAEMAVGIFGSPLAGS